MRFDIEIFKSVIDRNKGLAKPNRFFVSLVPPLAVERNLQIMNNIEFFCEAVNLPGIVLQTSDNRRYTYGPIEKRPFGVMVEPLRMTILADQAGNMWKFFHNWVNYIIPHTLKGGIDNVVGTDVKSTGASYPYEVEYKDNYITDIAIYHLPENYKATEQQDPYNSCITRTICRDAFPSAVSDIQLAWSDDNSIAVFQVQMEFLEWHNVKNEN